MFSFIWKIRFPMDKSVAGYVVSTSQVINIKDAYKDHQINHPTGYKIKSILCMPMLIWDNIIGLVKMGNKVHGCFTTLDEYAIEMFAMY